MIQGVYTREWESILEVCLPYNNKCLSDIYAIVLIERAANHKIFQWKKSPSILGLNFKQPLEMMKTVSHF